MPVRKWKLAICMQQLKLDAWIKWPRMNAITFSLLHGASLRLTDRNTTITCTCARSLKRTVDSPKRKEKDLSLSESQTKWNPVGMFAKLNGHVRVDPLAVSRRFCKSLNDIVIRPLRVGFGGLWIAPFIRLARESNIYKAANKRGLMLNDRGVSGFFWVKTDVRTWSWLTINSVSSLMHHFTENTM